MANKKTAVRFLGGFAPNENFLGIIAFPEALDGHDIEHTRFFSATTNGWGQQSFDSDIISVTFESGQSGKFWHLAGKRGDIYSISPSGTEKIQIPDAGTGPGKYGYLSNLKLINGKLLACGFCRQVYEHTNNGWIHQDEGILLDADEMDSSLEDIAGNSEGTLCAVGLEGEIAIRVDGRWSMIDSPTNVDLHAVCSDDQGSFYAAGVDGVVVRGSEAGFEVLCSGDIDGSLWDIKYFQGEVVVSASDGLFVVREGSLVPFDKPASPAHVGYKLATAQGVLWSIGTHQIFRLDSEGWKEWVCPDNAA